VSSTAPLTRRVAHTMGMAVSLAMRGRHADDGLGADAWAAVMEELDAVDRTFSTYRPDSAVSRLGRGEVALEECPAEVAEVLELAALAEQASHGAFRIRLPGPEGTEVLDPSGVVKGWAVERAARHLAALPDTDFSLSAGGDLVCRTVDPYAEPWRIGVEDPRDPARLLAVVPVRNGAVATSGTAHRGEHLVDGRTGRPPAEVASVTVVADNLTWADIDATAAFALGPDAARWLREERDRTGLVVWRDGSVELLEGSAIVAR